MKKTKSKPAKKIEPPIFQVAVRKRGTKSNVAAAEPISPKRENIFSKSRDTREDRSARQMKTTKNSQTFSHR